MFSKRQQKKINNCSRGIFAKSRLEQQFHELILYFHLGKLKEPIIDPSIRFVQPDFLMIILETDSTR